MTSYSDWFNLCIGSPTALDDDVFDSWCIRGQSGTYVTQTEVVIASDAAAGQSYAHGGSIKRKRQRGSFLRQSGSSTSSSITTPRKTIPPPAYPNGGAATAVAAGRRTRLAASNSPSTEMANGGIIGSSGSTDLAGKPGSGSSLGQQTLYNGYGPAGHHHHPSSSQNQDSSILSGITCTSVPSTSTHTPTASVLMSSANSQHGATASTMHFSSSNSANALGSRPGVVTVPPTVTYSGSIRQMNGYSSGRYTPKSAMVNGYHHHSSSPTPGSAALSNNSSPKKANSGSPCNGMVAPIASSSGHSSPTDEGLMVIRMKPDAQGRFGFNVKGGADQNHPVIVSRVVPGSSADACYPRLNEGDQVLFINGRDVSQHSHDQVVRFIRSARESHSGELVLTVRPNVYVGEDEPEFQYVLDTPHLEDSVPRADLLSESLLLLRDALASGAALAQFEQLYRKRPGATMNACRLSENVHKNRYRDIAPYDNTRVIIQKSSTNGNYINANFVNMEIPATGIVNRYIAAQGPLPHTVADFWQVVWEQLCNTIVMLTGTVERGRIKCHQYWPSINETQDYGSLQVKCLRESETSICTVRDFSITQKESKEERQVSQMQYIAWPDHGVPDDAKQFVDFVIQARQVRAGTVEPILVHCSAGIGRTGVLILMETAMCLIEANEPIYPLDIVRSMRDQRAMLIQTSSQYKFVCEAILQVYNDGVVKPLNEYKSHR